MELFTCASLKGKSKLVNTEKLPALPKCYTNAKDAKLKNADKQTRSLKPSFESVFLLVSTILLVPSIISMLILLFYKIPGSSDSLQEEQSDPKDSREGLRTTFPVICVLLFLLSTALYLIHRLSVAARENKAFFGWGLDKPQPEEPVLDSLGSGMLQCANCDIPLGVIQMPSGEGADVNENYKGVDVNKNLNRQKALPFVVCYS